MTYSLLLGGYRSSISLASFDPSTAKLKLLSDSRAPKNASWIEAASTPATKSADGNQVFYSLSEDEKGVAFGLELNGEQVHFTQERVTHGIPAHVHSMKDGSGIVVANYVGASIVFFPTSSTTHALSADSESSPLLFSFPYERKKASNTERQDAPHPHQVIEGANAVLYVPDLGSDRVWVVKRDGGSGLKIDGYLQAPAGSGPRHVALSLDGKHLYCLTELHHTVIAWSLDGSYASSHPLPDFEVSIVPPSVPSSHAKYVDSAELCLHPSYPKTLFASNRLELQIFKKEPNLPPIPNYPPSGDAIAILLLSENGQKVEKVRHVRTGCDNVRGMSVSPDGKYVALAGQDGGGLEIWAVLGEKGDEWKLAGKEESIEKITTIVWV